MKILVLGGCGSMGSEATRDLSLYSDFEEIVVADIDVKKAENYCNELKDKRLKSISVDVTNKNNLLELFPQFNVVLNCTTYHFGLIITEAAIEAKTPILDLGGLYNTPKQLALTDKAKASSVTILLGCGATPGITNLMAQCGVKQMDKVNEIHIAFGSFRSIAPSPGLLDTIMDEFSPGTKRFYFKEGEFVEVPPFSGEKKIKFLPPVNEQFTYLVPHSETHTLSRFIEGVKLVDVRGTWKPEIMQALRLYNSLDLLSSEPVTIKGTKISPKEFLRQFYLEKKHNIEGEWAFLLNVEVIGTKGNKECTIIYNLSHPPTSEWGQTATARVTGIPASIGAQLLAKGKALNKGVIAPEICFDCYEFFNELAKRKIHIHEKVVHESGINI